MQRVPSLLVSVLLLAACTSSGAGSSLKGAPSVKGLARPTDAASPSSDAPTMVSVECRDRRLSADTKAVSATAAGLRVRVDNATTRPTFLQFTQGSLGPWGGIEVDSGTTTLAIQMPPGRATIRCYDGRGHATNELHLLAQEGLAQFVPYALECKKGVQRVTPAAMNLASQVHVHEEPVDAVSGAVTGVRLGDVVEVAGYPRAPEPTLRLVRGGRVLAAFQLTASGRSWAVSFVACSEARLTPRH